jgi:CheY-like chemotaxis protein
LIFPGADVSTEVLVVDDSPQLAQETAALINVGAQLETGFASDSTTALQMVEQHPISVVVLDQRMGTDLSGTELFQRLCAVRPDIRAIMLTGEAGPDEVGQALELGFRDYLPKGRIADLPGRVLLQHVKSKVTDLEQHTKLENLLLWPRRPRLRLRRGAEIRLVSRRVVEERFVDPSSWMTVLQVNAGEERRIARQVTRSASVVVEERSQRTLQANIGLKTHSVGEVTSALQSVLAESSKWTHTVNNSATDSTEQTFRLPAEPDAPGPVYVRARLYQRAPVHRKILVTLSAVCKCCDLSTRIPVVVLQDVGLLATRHEDHMSDQSVRVVETGDVGA